MLHCSDPYSHSVQAAGNGMMSLPDCTCKANGFGEECAGSQPQTAIYNISTNLLVDVGDFNTNDYLLSTTNDYKGSR